MSEPNQDEARITKLEAELATMRKRRWWLVGLGALALFGSVTFLQVQQALPCARTCSILLFSDREDCQRKCFRQVTAYRMLEIGCN